MTDIRTVQMALTRDSIHVATFLDVASELKSLVLVKINSTDYMTLDKTIGITNRISSIKLRNRDTRTVSFRSITAFIWLSNLLIGCFSIL